MNQHKPINNNPSSNGQTDLRSTSTLSSTVYNRIREEIVLGSLKPDQKLRVEFLCTRYKIGASPIREALNRLSSEGLATHHDQRGFSVAAVSHDELRELVDARCWIEEIALSQSIKHRDQAWEEGVVLAFHHLTRSPRSTSPTEYPANQEWEVRHRAFHDAIIANCKSHYLLRICREMRDQSDRYRHLAAVSAYPARRRDDEHKAIMDAAIDGRASEASGLLRHHYERTFAIIADGAFSPSETHGCPEPFNRTPIC